MSRYDFLDWYFITLYIIFEVIEGIISAYLLYKAYKEIYHYFIDIIKLVLYSLFIILTMISLMNTGIYVFDRSHNLYIRHVFVTMYDIIMLTFSLICIVYWILMIYYIQKLKMIDENTSYRQIKNQINRFEIKMGLVVVLYFIIPITLFITVYVIQRENNCFEIKDGHLIYLDSPSVGKIPMILSLALFVFQNFSQILFLIILVIVYYRLCSIMKSSLYVYYQENKKSLRMLMVVNVIYYGGGIADLFIFNLDGITDRRANSLFSLSGLSVGQTIELTLELIILFSSFILFGIYNTKNIDFKLYVASIMYGLKIQHRFEGTSLLIVRSGKSDKEGSFSDDQSENIRLQLKSELETDNTEQ